MATPRSSPGRPGNETIFKNSMSLFDDLDFIQVAYEFDRKKVLDVLRKHKITMWPDGRKIEDVVKVI